MLLFWLAIQSKVTTENITLLDRTQAGQTPAPEPATAPAPYVPPDIDIRWTSQLLPRNRTAWEVVIEGVDADLVARDPTWLIPAARDPFKCPIELLPYLAAERSVDEFSSAWSEDRRRAVVDGSFAYHRVKGTRPALDRALTPLGYNLQVAEWFEFSPPHDPYTFSIKVTVGEQDTWKTSDFAQLVRIANRAKNAHTKLESIEVSRQAPPAPIYIGGMPRKKRTIRVGQIPTASGLFPPNAYVFIGAAITSRRTLRIYQRT